MNEVMFSKPSSLKKWSYLLISLPGYRDAFDSQSLGQNIKTFGQALMAAGMNVAAPLAGQRLELNDMDDARLDIKMEAAARNLELLLIILPDTPIPIYNRIKHLGDVKYGIHTICTVGHKMAKERGQDQYMTNVALKFNLKLGGNNQLLEDSRLGIIREDKTMVVGIDVTHPSPGSSSKAPSIAGMVANVDRFLGQWPATLRIQTDARQEMVSDLEAMLQSRLLLWKRKGGHKEYPENILVYRDGVSEGQYQKVLDEELPLLRKACESTYPPVDQKKGLPRFTIVIVGKRHHTRFYPTREADADRSSNCKAGTVVDRGVTEARNWDFFLQAHAAIQGTARPAHYFVVIDEVFRHRYKVVPQPYRNVADILEELTQAMCYTFGRATKAVSICTPAYYADILCERARCYLSGVFETPTHSAAPSIAGSESGTSVTNQDVEIHERLRDTMFYI
jgi:eukaryotic translation initiation factor 2C